jgi:hypothetical protein
VACRPAARTLARGSTPGGCNASNFLIINDKTGARHAFHLYGAEGPFAFGVPWIVFGLTAGGYTTGLELYNVVTNRTERISAKCHCWGLDYAIGARWLEFYVQEPGSCGDGEHESCGPSVYYAYDLVRHTRRRNLRLTSPYGLVGCSPSSYTACYSASTTVLDLNSPRLVQRICAPLSVPIGGSLTLYGGFAVVTAPQPGSGPGASMTLEECGSQLQMPLAAGLAVRPTVVGNSRALAWAVTNTYGERTGEIDGLLLPSLNPFSFTIPTTFAIQPPNGIFTIAMDAERLYITDANGNVYSAPFPS